MSPDHLLMVSRLLMMSRLRLACASVKDFANDIDVTEAPTRQDRCRELAVIPALQPLS